MARYDFSILNETEAEALTDTTDLEEVCARMRERYPQAATVLTLGAAGAMYSDASTRHKTPAVSVRAVDTTAAGDTFIGYFLAGLMQSGDPCTALTQGCRAAAVCVTKPGASDSIPLRKDVDGCPEPA